MIIIVALTIVALFLSFVQYKIWLAKHQRAYGPNPPEVGWLSGHAMSHGHIRDFLNMSFFSKAHFIRVFILSILHVSEDKLAKQLFNEDLRFEKGVLYRPYKLWFKEGLTPTEGEKGRALRKKVAPAFSKARQQVFVPTFNRVSSTLIRRWLKLTKGQSWVEIDAFADTRLLTIDAICDSCGVKDAKGQPVSTLSDSSQLLLAAFHYIWNEASHQRYLSSKNQVVALFSKYLSPKGKLFSQHVSFVQRLSEEAIANRRLEISQGQQKQSEYERDFLDHFLEMKLDDLQTRDLIINFMFAATDTVALSISWTLVLLAKYPNWQEVIYEELKEEEGAAFSPTSYAYDTKTTKAGYLVACLNESMRLFPPLPFLSRKTTANETFEVEDGGLKHRFNVHEEQEILVSFWALHRDESKWDRPNDFDPLRFYSPTGESPRTEKEKGTFCPFSLGRRNCIGQTYAITEAVVVLARLIKQFHFSVDESFDINTHPLYFSTSLQPAEKIKLCIKPRASLHVCNG